jgi:hypothetical protein
MGGLSICATVLESEIRGEDSAFFHFVITKAIVGEISLSPAPENAHAIITSRRGRCSLGRSHRA